MKMLPLYFTEMWLPVKRCEISCNQLLIEETEAEAIRIIFDKFENSDIGLGGVAKYLNLQGMCQNSRKRYKK